MEMGRHGDIVIESYLALNEGRSAREAKSLFSKICKYHRIPYGFEHDESSSELLISL
jgi:hypothetical protein